MDKPEPVTMDAMIEKLTESLPAMRSAVEDVRELASDYERLTRKLLRLRHRYAAHVLYTNNAIGLLDYGNKNVVLSGIQDKDVAGLVQMFIGFPLGKCCQCGMYAPLQRLEKMDNVAGLMHCAWDEGCDDEGEDEELFNGDTNEE